MYTVRVARCALLASGPQVVGEASQDLKKGSKEAKTSQKGGIPPVYEPL